MDAECILAAEDLRWRYGRRGRVRKFPATRHCGLDGGYTPAKQIVRSVRPAPGTVVQRGSTIRLRKERRR
jgi:hypothetical protein